MASKRARSSSGGPRVVSTGVYRPGRRKSAAQPSADRPSSPRARKASAEPPRRPPPDDSEFPDDEKHPDDELPEGEGLDPRERVMTVGDHLEELRKRLMAILGVVGATAVIALIFSQQLHAFLVGPYKILSDEKLIMQNVYGNFEVMLKVSITTALTATLPISFWILWGFVTPAVSRKAAFLGNLIVGCSALLFWAGAALCWLYIFPLSLEFLFINILLDAVSPQTSVEKYYSFLYLIHIGCGVAFQLPLVLIVLGALGIVTVETHKRIWKFVIPGIFTFAALITPPDYVSQLMVGTLLLVLYAISVLVVWLVERPRRRKARAKS